MTACDLQFNAVSDKHNLDTHGAQSIFISLGRAYQYLLANDLQSGRLQSHGRTRAGIASLDRAMLSFDLSDVW